VLDTPGSFIAPFCSDPLSGEFDRARPTGVCEDEYERADSFLYWRRSSSDSAAATSWAGVV